MRSSNSLFEILATLFVAFALALVIWFNATQTEDPVRTRFVEVPIEVVGLPNGTTLVNGVPRESVQIRLEGPDSALREVVPADFTAAADLSDVPPGETVEVPIDISGGHEGVEVSFITPESIEVRLEQLVSREIPVELDIRGTVARGHTQGEPLADPPVVNVSGPGSRVNELDFALVTVFLNSAVETISETVQPIFYDESGRVASVTGLELDVGSVTVTIPVEESAGFAEKLVNVVWTGEPAPGYRLLSVTADPPSVLVEGRPAQVNALSSVRTEPIDITGLTESFQQVAVLDLPGTITVDPDQVVTVFIEIEPILTTDSFNRPPVLLGLNEGFEGIVRPTEVRVVLFGPLPVLDSLQDEDIRVTLDLFGLDPGRYSVIPDVDVPDRGIEIRSVQPSAVSVVITPTITPTREITPTLTPGSFLPAPETELVATGTGATSGGRVAACLPLPVSWVSSPLGPLCLPHKEIQ